MGKPFLEATHFTTPVLLGLHSLIEGRPVSKGLHQALPSVHVLWTEKIVELFRSDIPTHHRSLEIIM